MLLEQHIFTNANYSQSNAKAFENNALVNLGLDIQMLTQIDIGKNFCCLSFPTCVIFQLKIH